MTSHHQIPAEFDSHQCESCIGIENRTSKLEIEEHLCRKNLDDVSALIASLLNELASSNGAMVNAAKEEIASARSDEKAASKDVVGPGLQAIAQRIGDLKSQLTLLDDESEFDTLLYKERAGKIDELDQRFTAALNRYTGAYGGFSSKLAAFNRWWDECE